MLSIRNDASAHCVMPCIDEVRDAIDSVDSLTHSSTELAAAESMATKFSKYYTNRPNQFIIAHVLDPRTKLELVRREELNSNSQLSPSPSTSTTTPKTELYRRIVKSCYNKHFKSSSSHEEGGSTDAATNSRRTNSTSTLGVAPNRSFFHNKINALNDSESVSQLTPETEMDEVDRYLLEPRVIDATNIFDILKWWKENSERFPRLSVMAKWFLTIQASSVASESCFSTSGRIITPDRASLSPETLSVLMLCESWLKASNKYKWKKFGYYYDK